MTERKVKRMGRFIVKLCFWPFLLPIWILKGLFNLLGALVVGAAIDNAVFGRR